LASIVAEVGRTVAFDARYFYLAKMRLSKVALDALADYYERTIRAGAGKRKKVMAVDLDNTLWGGIVGEDGPGNLLLSRDGIGRAYHDLQKILLDYHRTGILLSVCSKNDHDLAMSVIREHPDMILRPHHFAAIRINWQNKASNLRSLSEELNLGLESFVFLDDSPFEREQVRYTIPEVTVIDLPEDASEYPAVIATLPYFDTLGVTEVDRNRQKMYTDEHRRTKLRQTTDCLHDFLKELRIQVMVRRAKSFDLPRLAQLTQRTNQFNLTTRRYMEKDLQSMLESGEWILYAAESKDKIGDSGIVGTALVSFDSQKNHGHLDTFLLSCRVLGRGIEAAFIAAILEDMKNVGIPTMFAEYIPTQCNDISKDFLATHGFVVESDIWKRSSANAQDLLPDWIELHRE
jgi:FkbH-like protein